MSQFVYCLNASTIKTTPILDQIRVAGEAGYQAIELWHDDIDALVAGGGQLSDITKALQDHGLQVPTTIFLKGWWDTVGQVYDSAMDETRRRLAQSQAIGATFAIAGPPLGPVDFCVGAKNYARLLEIGREFGIKPVMEYLGFSEEVNSIEAAIRVMTDCGDDQATTVLDPFHCFRGGGPLTSIKLLSPDQIAIAHFNDSPDFPPARLQQDCDRVMPGDGSVDLTSFCRYLSEIGYDRCLSLELFNRQQWARNPLDVAVEGLEKMRSVAEAAT